ncbi:MAG: hypothetical protein HRU06_08095 [Oceanospirillaceae bacterium]|nr:hypothetical protein [Oceanospirillaceae bacterium]
MHSETDLYRQMSALDAEHFNTCFYCGCIATEYDLVPGIKHAEFYLRTREEADFYKVPACRECFYFLKDDNSALLGQRVDVAKRCLARKYKKAIRIYEVWNIDEIDELDYQLKHSVNAGMILGKESCQRVAFTGFDYEADGVKHSTHFVKNEVFVIFGEKFDNFRDALEHGHKAYRIPKAKLIELFTEHNHCFDTAINSFHEKLTRKILDKNLKRQCTAFALKHKQNLKFVMRTIELYCTQDQRLTYDMALDKLYLEIIRD